MGQLHNSEVMHQIVEDCSELVDDLNTIFGEAGLLLYLDLHDVLSTQPGSETLTLPYPLARVANPS